MGRIQVGADYTQIEKRQEAILQMLALCPRNGEVEVGDSDDIIAAQAVKKILLKHPYIAVISWDRGGKVSVGYAEGLAASMSAGTLQELQAASNRWAGEGQAVFAKAFSPRRRGGNRGPGRQAPDRHGRCSRPSAGSGDGAVRPERRARTSACAPPRR